MNLRFTTLWALLLSTGIFAQSYQLIWSDEFSGTSVDQSKWVFEIGNNNGWGNNELQYYTSRTDNAYLSDGNLVIKAVKENYSGKNYTSTRIKTQGKFSVKYGKIEARIKLPFGKGIWPAFWMLGDAISFIGWPKCGEIDIMEMIGGSTGGDKTIYGTAHWDNNGHAQYGLSYKLPQGNFSDDFHTFDIVWDSQKIIWHVDGIQYCAFALNSNLDAFQKSFFLLLNLAVGGNWPGNPDNTTVFPQTMTIDYVRVYQLASGAEDDSPEVPHKFSLKQNYPNPFNPSTLITYSLPISERIKLQIFDTLGREVAVLADGWKEAGEHKINFENGVNALSNGVYFYQLIAGNNVLTKKMLLLK